AIAFALLIITPVFAIEINPSVNSIPFYCRSSITLWICDIADSGPQGTQGINGTPGSQGLPNFSAIYYNASNFTAYQNASIFVNATNFTSDSNFTVFEGSTFYNGSINESYAYLPGRDGGQTLNGGTTTGDLVLNGSANNGNVVIQPNGGFTVIGAGIGSTPAEPLRIIGGGSFLPVLTIIRNSSTNSNRAIVLDSGSLSQNYAGIEFKAKGVTSGSMIQEGTTKNMYIQAYGNFLYQAGAALPIRMAINGSTGYVVLGGGPTLATQQFDMTGDARFRNCSGTPTMDAGGNMTCASDPKLKTAVTAYTTDSAKVASIVPISYKWNTASGYDTVHTNTGFDALQVSQVYPECIIARDDVTYSQICDKEEVCNTVEKKTGTQTLSIDDKCLIAVLFNAAKDQQKTITSLETRITALEKGTVKP
ncbi:MAG: tail fiber domain-containing protein, partial [Methanoregula sp.]|nr:tail fiber domain-containing protein [Methanoregula sp.]